MPRRRLSRHLATAVAAPLMLAGMLVGLEGTAASANTCQAWTTGQPPPSPGTVLGGVAVLSVCDVWAVGTSDATFNTHRTVIDHWTGGSNWTQAQSPNPEDENDLHAVTAVSATNIWAVGSQAKVEVDELGVVRPLILHWDGIGWTQWPGALTTSGGGILTAVKALTANNIWAVGRTSAAPAKTLILHYDGTGWTQIPSPSPGPNISELTGVTGTSASNAWAVGDYYSPEIDATRTLILHWNGSTWTQMQSPSPGSSGSFLTAITAVSASYAWAVGAYSDGSQYQGLMLHWDGSSWSKVDISPSNPSPGSPAVLTGVAATSATNGWAVGDFGNPRQPYTLRWDGTSWSDGPSPPASTDNQLDAVAASSGSSVWAVGGLSGQAFATPVQDSQYLAAVNMRGGTLYEAGLVNGPTSQSIAAGTTPAAALNTSGGSRVAWTGANGHLFLIDQAGQRTDTGQSVAAGTTPAITALSGGGYQTVFVNAADGQLWQVTPDGAVTRIGPGYTPAPGTSPAIAADGVGGYQIAAHGANTDDLWTITPDGTGTDTGLKVAAGTSPAITALPGGYQIIYVNAASGQLWQVTPGGASRQVGPGYTPAPGTSPAIAADGVGGYRIAAHGANTDDLWTISTGSNGTTGTDTGLKVAAGTSPAIAPRNGAFEIAFAAGDSGGLISDTGDLVTVTPDGIIQDHNVVMTAGTSPALAEPGPFIAARTTVPLVTGSRQADAEATIHAAGLAVGPTPPDNTCKDTAGTVVDQDPGARQIVPTGTPVTLDISSGVDGHGKKCIIA